ncbi:SDR family oxidoreductase [Actinoplanes sp. M2I2]|uniref:SDR family oxidoreductase n=1 Tax=Actinoplanes sp. M2I2 TaxID=1734444 RepID=UPI0020212F81|nr:SDR family oxidoreductase [Actinoplanes sp. M2I2]
MRIFITGGTGFIGTAVVHDLIAAGHDVAGLARSDRSAGALTEAGAKVIRGSLDDLEVLQDAARASDGVIHVAFPPDWDDFNATVAADRRVIAALGEAVAGSDRSLVIASGTALMRPGQVLDENDLGDPASAGPRRETEQDLLKMSGEGVRGVVVRLGTSVHGQADRSGFIPGFIAAAREHHASAYIGTGDNRWPAVHQLDAARVFRLAAESAPAGSILHAVGDEGIPFRDIAERIGKHLNLPTISLEEADAPRHFSEFGELAFITGQDIPASSALTQSVIDWQPQHPGLLEDLDQGFYFTR